MITSAKPWEALEAGAIWRGWWETGLPGPPALPVLAARGRQSGPTLVVTGGVHGDEYEGPTAIQALFADLDMARLCGRVLGLPVLNMAAWEARSRVTPADGLNLNRVFPGRPEETGPTAALAQVVFETFVRPCAALVDLHSGGAALDHLPLIGWYGDAVSQRVGRGFGAALHPWRMPDVPGVLSYEAHRAAKVALGAEWHGGARLDLAGVAAYTEGLRRILQALEMIPMEGSAAEPADTRLPIAGDYQETAQGGLFVPQVALGDRVEAGTRLGTLRDALGETVAAIRAEHGGIVAGLPHIAWLRPGDRVAYIG